MAARATYNFTKTWLTDPSTYPIIAIMTVALTGASFTMMRYSTQHPDVHFDKDRRQDFFTYQPGEGEHWRAHRFTLANGKRNPINQSQLFDPIGPNEYQAGRLEYVDDGRSPIYSAVSSRVHLVKKRHLRVVATRGVLEMDNRVLHKAERFEDTVEKVEYLEVRPHTDMTAFHATAAGRRATNDGPMRMPTDKTHAANSMTLVDDIPGRFTDRQFRELLRLHRESPAQWPVPRLAVHFGADVTTIHNIVNHCCPPKITPPSTTVSHPIGTWWEVGTSSSNPALST
ncbi:hypothetical protein DYB28_005198 [Aphanomyces astaci]|nr:hypothetical protein DYB28_005198 [Aphanomyces astaci]